VSAKHKQGSRSKVLIAAAGAMVAAAVAVVPFASASDRAPGEPNAAGSSIVDAKPVMETLKKQASIPGTAWAADPNTGQILVTADRTVTGEKWNTLMAAVNSMGQGAARVERISGELRLFAAGGDAIFADGARCSLGFNVTTGDGSPGFLTAGHCGVAADRWSLSQNGRPAATVQEATFPGRGDFALLTYDDQGTAAESVVDTGGGRTVQIRQAADAKVGQRVSRMGSTTGLQSGAVTGLNATVNYPEGTVTGLIETTVCAEPGDSGGPLFTSDGSAIGLTSGGSGDCTSGGQTFFQPVTTALRAVSAQIGGSDGAANPGTETSATRAQDGGRQRNGR
jgi:streptogrisin D